MSTRHRIKFEDSSHTLKTTLDSRLAVPTTASVTCKDHSGNVLLNGTIASVGDLGAGYCTYTYTGHAVAVGDVVLIAGTALYDSSQTVTGIAAGTFTTTEAFVATATGTYTITAAAATVLTATTLSAAATAGEAEITLTAVTNLVEGSLVRIAMSADGSEEDVEIASVNTSTKVCGLADYLKFDHTSGAAVSGRFLSYTLDASQSDFTSGLDFDVIWDLNTDDPAWREDAEILKREVAFGGLEAACKTRFSHFYTEIASGEFAAYQAAAFNSLRNKLINNDGQDLDKLVNPDALSETILWKIANNIAMAGDDSWAAERVSTKQQLNEEWDDFLRGQGWIDDNQDDIKTDSEAQRKARPFPRRNLIG